MDLKLLVPRVKSAGAGSFFSEGGILHALRDAARIVCEDSLCSVAKVNIVVDSGIAVSNLKDHAGSSDLTNRHQVELSWDDVEPIKIVAVRARRMDSPSDPHLPLVCLPTPGASPVSIQYSGANEAGVPFGYYDNFGELVLYPRPSVDMSLEVEFAYRPGPETTVVDIPRQAELAIIHQALVSLLPLGTQVRQAAEVRARDYMADFTGSARTGTSGLFAATVRGGSFVGRKR